MVAVPLTVEILVLLACIAAGGWDARRLRRRVPSIHVDDALRHAPHLYAAAVLLVIPLAGNVALRIEPDWLWQLPLWAQYHLSALHWGLALVAFAYLFAFITTLAHATHHPERHKLPVAGVLLVAVVLQAQHTYTRPIAPTLHHEVTPDGVILQTSGKSCVAASGANVVRLLGGDATEKQMAELYGTADGTSPAQVVYGMREIGIDCTPLELDPSGIEALHPPVMLFVDHPVQGYEAHATVFVGLHQDAAEIWDPLSGKELIPRRDLPRRWHGHGLACTRTPEARL